MSHLFAKVIDVVTKETKEKTKLVKLRNRRMKGTEEFESVFVDDMVQLADAELELQYDINILKEEL